MMKLNIQLFANPISPATAASWNAQDSTGSSGYQHKIILKWYFSIDQTNRTFTIYAKVQFYHQVTDGNWTNSKPYNQLLIDNVEKACTTNNLGSPSGKGTFDICPSFGNTDNSKGWQKMGTYSYDENGNGAAHTLGAGCGYASTWGGISRTVKTKSVTPPKINPAKSRFDSFSYSIDSSNNAKISWSYYKYTQPFYNSFDVLDQNNLRSFLIWVDTGEPAGTVSESLSIDKSDLAYIASMQGTASPTLKGTLTTYTGDIGASGTINLGSDTKTVQATVGKSTFTTTPFSSITMEMNNGEERIHFVPNITSFAEENIRNNITIYATNSTKAYTYQIYSGTVSNGTNYYITGDVLDTLFNYAGNANSVYVYAVVDSYAINGTYTPWLGQQTSDLITIPLPSQTLAGSTTVTELNTSLNTYKASGYQNKVFFKKLSRASYAMTGYLSGHSNKTKIYGQTRKFLINNTSVGSPYTVDFNVFSDYPTVEAAIDRTIVTAADIHPTGLDALVDYSYPAVTYTVTRTDNNGTAQQTGSYIKLVLNVAYTTFENINHLRNLLTPTLTWSLKEGTSTIAQGTITSGLTNTITLLRSGFDYRKSAVLTIDFTDRINNSITTIAKTIPPGRPGMYGYKVGATNHTVINDDLKVDGTLNTTGNTSVSGNLAVSGNSTVSGDLAVTGKLKGYTWDTGTNNTTDTWVPVFNGSTIQHRVIPAAYNNAPSTLSVNYANSAGSASSATSATTASKLGSSTIGGSNQPIYLNGGTPTACNSLPIVTSGSSCFSKSSGQSTITSSQWVKWGRMISVRLVVKTTAQVNSGTNIMEGTISAALKPYLEDADGLGYYGGRCIALRIKHDGTFILRNAGYQESGIAKNSSISVSATYISAS